MSGFFLSDSKGSASKPRKRQAKSSQISGFRNKKQRGKQSLSKAEHIDEDEFGSDSDVPSDKEEDIPGEEESSDHETAQEKRLRLAKQYLAQLEKEEQEKKESDDIDHDAIAHRLKQDVLEQTGRFQKRVASQYTQPSPAAIRVLKGHQLSVTCLCVSPDDKFVFSASKDCSIIKWNIETGLKEGKILGCHKASEGSKGHKGHVLCLAVTSDGKFLASGGRDKIIHIWDPASLQHVHTFKGHKDAVSGLAFRRGTHQLFSCSHDRTAKIWNLDEMAYVETLFGHEDGVTAIDSLTRDRAVSAGGRDRSLRVWKVVEESQLVFNAPGNIGSLDCVQLINDEHMVSGADNSSLSLWSVSKKKPLCTIPNAHSKPDCSSDDSIPDESWITSIASLRSTDLLASAGSCDSCIKLWECGDGFRSLKQLFSVSMVGFVNALAFSNNGNNLIAGIGQEHRLGRWWRLKKAKNCVCVIPLQRTVQNGVHA
ncbi:U3 small nucleolar RNA-interacting protein 2-like isoform X1 [Pocillopora verrucosa]|uniref:U3 small nucleolar RNA-interacting protein 2-like isoform X1 n=1 Tax=Pocillopora verrucosa TaxID=203993 RepID=UPI00333F6974